MGPHHRGHRGRLRVEERERGSAWSLIMAYRNSILIGMGGVVVLAGIGFLLGEPALRYLGLKKSAPTAVAAAPPQSPPDNSVELQEGLVASVKVQAVEERDFPIEKDAVGSIDFNGDMTVQVFAQYQGRIIELFSKIGDEVRKGQTLYTIDSPDLLQAASTLITTAGVLELTTRTLVRLRDLAKTKAIPQKDLEQAISDQQAAEGAYKASRDALLIFGKTDHQIDPIVTDRPAHSTLS